ncbi:MAG: histidine kinase [Cyclobacteriaceae bacterium]
MPHIRLFVPFIIVLISALVGQKSTAQNRHYQLIQKCLDWDGVNQDSLRSCVETIRDVYFPHELDAYKSYLLARSAKDKAVQARLFKEAISLAQQTGDYYLAGQSSYRLGRVYSVEASYDSALKLYDQAHIFFDRSCDHSLIDPVRRKCVVYTSQAFISNQINEYEASIAYSLSGLRLAEQADFKDLRLICLINLSAAYGELASPDNRIGTAEDKNRYKAYSKQYTFQSAALAEVLGDDRRLHRSYGNIGTYYVYENELDSARMYLTQAVALGKKTGDEMGLANDYNMLSLLFKERGQLDSATYYGSLALQMAQATGLKTLQADALLTLGEMALAQRKPADANEYLTQSIALAEKLDVPKVASHAYELLHQLARNMGNSDLALDYYKKSMMYRDSVASLDNLNHIEGLKTQYETEKKERQIDNLQKEAVIAELQIRQQRVFLFGVLVLLIIGGTAGYALYRNRNLRETQRRLIVEQKLLRSQMNPHFLFNALSSVHGYIYEGDKQQAAEYLSMFSELTRDILNYSSKELILLVEELETLRKYMSLQQLRFPEINYQVEISETLDLKDLLIPPMLLQPFVENAIEHGLKDKMFGNISVAIGSQDQKLLITIEDDGVGLGEQVEKSGGIHAVEIARERIALLPGMKAVKNVLEIENINKVGETGVIVTIKLPILEE